MQRCSLTSGLMPIRSVPLVNNCSKYIEDSWIPQLTICGKSLRLVRWSAMVNRHKVLTRIRIFSCSQVSMFLAGMQGRIKSLEINHLVNHLVNHSVNHSVNHFSTIYSTVNHPLTNHSRLAPRNQLPLLPSFGLWELDVEPKELAWTSTSRQWVMN